MFEIEAKNAVSEQRRQVRERQAYVRSLVRQRRLARQVEHQLRH